MLHVVMLSVIMLNGIMLSFIMLNVVMLSVIMLNVVAPKLNVTTRNINIEFKFCSSQDEAQQLCLNHSGL
jgi:hypothetical protein